MAENKQKKQEMGMGMDGNDRRRKKKRFTKFAPKVQHRIYKIDICINQMLCTRDTIYDCLLSIPYISFDGVKYYLRRIGFIHLWSFFFSLLVVVVKTSKHTSTYDSGTLANLIFETFGFGLYGVCSLSARNWPLSLFDILHFRLHVLCAHSTHP